jgi:hypothetical protein
MVTVEEATPVLARIAGIAFVGGFEAAIVTPPPPVQTAEVHVVTLEEFEANLTGSSERPNPVSTLARGEAALSFDGTGPINYSVKVSNLTGPASGAHIHGPADTSRSAGVFVDLKVMKNALDGDITNGTITAADVKSISLDSLKAIFRAGRAYVNIHTSSNPGGEIRGQIMKK